MNRWLRVAVVGVVLLEALAQIAQIARSDVPSAGPPRLATPPDGTMYHGVYPGELGVLEHGITRRTLDSYERRVGRAAWVYFSDEWHDGIGFPDSTARWIKDVGRIPYIRMTPRSLPEMANLCRKGSHEPEYPLGDILGTKYDGEIGRWMRDARNLDWPIIVEFGPEVNGCWFPWNGHWNGRDTLAGYGNPKLADGPERFRDAFRKLVEVARDSGATNIIWVFHVVPGEVSPSWNAFEEYYPGCEWVDWVAVSVYGPHESTEAWTSFKAKFAPVHARLTKMDSTKPIIVAEFGARKDRGGRRQAAWADSALQYLLDERPARVIGFSWWNSAFPDASGGLIDMRVQGNRRLARRVRDRVNTPAVLDLPIVIRP